jgi:hypothetical protein
MADERETSPVEPPEDEAFERWMDGPETADSEFAGHPEPTGVVHETREEFEAGLRLKRERLLDEIPKREKISRRFGFIMALIGAAFGIAGFLLFILGGVFYQWPAGVEIVFIIAGIACSVIAPFSFFIPMPVIRCVVIMALPLIAGEVSIFVVTSQFEPNRGYALIGAFVGSLMFCIMTVIFFVMTGAFATAVARRRFPIAGKTAVYGRICAGITLAITFIIIINTVIRFNPSGFYFVYHGVFWMFAIAGVVLFAVLFIALQFLALASGDAHFPERVRIRAARIINLGYICCGIGIVLVLLALLEVIIRHGDILDRHTMLELGQILVFFSLISGVFFVTMSGYTGLLVHLSFKEWRSKVNIEIKRMEIELDAGENP